MTYLPLRKVYYATATIPTSSAQIAVSYPVEIIPAPSLASINITPKTALVAADHVTWCIEATGTPTLNFDIVVYNAGNGLLQQVTEDFVFDWSVTY